jgi:hypothetical protein
VIGLAFNLVERYLLVRHGDAMLDAALRRGGFADADPWLDALRYPEPDFLRWAEAAAACDGASRDEFLHRLGRWAMPQLVRRYTLLTPAARSPGQWMSELSGTVLPQLRRVLTGLSGADFAMHCEPGSADLSYASSGLLCPAIQGALAGLGDHFGTPLRVRHSACARDGGNCCRFALDFPAQALA